MKDMADMDFVAEAAAPGHFPVGIEVPVLQALLKKVLLVLVLMIHSCLNG
jgi:hypothetical protein